MSFIHQPLGQKVPRPSKAAGRAHMAKVAKLHCVLCDNWPVEVHHCKSDRFSSRRASDFDVIPLCYFCHRGPQGYHAGQETWEAKYGLDTDYLSVVADMLAGELN